MDAHVCITLPLRPTLLHGLANPRNQRRRPAQIEGQVLERNPDLLVALRVVLHYEVFFVPNDISLSMGGE